MPRASSRWPALPRPRRRRRRFLRTPDTYLVFLGLLIFVAAMVLAGETALVETMESDTFEPVPAAPPCAQYTARVDMVQVTASVLKGRHYVRGLPREAFRVFEDDAPRPVAYFAGESAPLQLFVAVDASSSLRKAMPLVKENARRFLTALPEADQVTLASFNDELHVLAEPSTPRQVRVDAIGPLVPYGMTSLYDVMLRSFDDLRGPQSGRRGIVIFTDGEDTASRASSATIEARAEASDAVIYILGHGQALTSPALKELCERLAHKSGGRAFFLRKTEDLSRAFTAIVDELSAQYLLLYEPKSKNPDGKYHRIRVEVAGGEYDVRARQGYRYGATR